MGFTFYCSSKAWWAQLSFRKGRPSPLIVPFPAFCLQDQETRIVSYKKKQTNRKPHEWWISMKGKKLCCCFCLLVYFLVLRNDFVYKGKKSIFKSQSDFKVVTNEAMRLSLMWWLKCKPRNQETVSSSFTLGIKTSWVTLGQSFSLSRTYCTSQGCSCEKNGTRKE